MKTVIILLLINFINCDDIIRYDNYTVHKILPKNVYQIDVLKRLQKENDEINFWTDVIRPGKPVHIMVSPDNRKFFQNVLNSNQIEDNISVSDVQKLINKPVRPKTRSTSKAFNFKDFHRLSTIYDYLENFAYLYPQNVKIVQGGKSYEGRDITGVHVSFSNLNENRTVFLEGGIHGREWIAPATVLYILNQILTSNEKKVIEVVQNHDWYIFPVINPDGYEYSHTNDRMWRKTRKPNDNCVGTDPNRNWGYQWSSKGSNSYGCSLTYAGSHAFSEIETKSMSDLISTIHHKLFAYISFHSFGQFILAPYGYTHAHLDNYPELKCVAEKAIDSLSRRRQTEYLFTTLAESTDLMTSGSSIDWVKGTYGTRFVYLYELPDSEYGFLIPPDNIIPVGEETLDSVITLLNEAFKCLNDSCIN